MVGQKNVYFTYFNVFWGVRFRGCLDFIPVFYIVLFLFQIKPGKGATLTEGQGQRNVIPAI